MSRERNVIFREVKSQVEEYLAKDRTDTNNRETWVSLGGDPDVSDVDIETVFEIDQIHDDQYGCYCCCPCHGTDIW